MGKCDSCGEWNSYAEETPGGGIGSGPLRSVRKGRVVALASLAGESEEAPRIRSGIAEFDRVTGTQSVYTEAFNGIAPRATRTHTYRVT